MYAITRPSETAHRTHVERRGLRRLPNTRPYVTSNAGIDRNGMFRSTPCRQAYKSSLDIMKVVTQTTDRRRKTFPGTTPNSQQ